MDWHLLTAYWSKSELITNGILLLHLLGSTAVGLLVGYERAYRGRAAGMRTYALVCSSSAMLVAIMGNPAQWYGGMGGGDPHPEPAYVIHGVVMGIGFLCAGVIMREGLTLRGISTSASIWATAAIGIVIGIGFYGAAIAMTVVTMILMTGLGSLERMLPHQSKHYLTLVYPHNKLPPPSAIRERMKTHGFDVLEWSFRHSEDTGRSEYELLLVTTVPCHSQQMVNDLKSSGDLAEFRLAPARS